MPKLPIISAKTLLKVLIKLNFRVLHQKGSHIKLVKDNCDKKQILVVPNHRIIRKGTLKNILRAIDLNMHDLIDFL